MPDNLKIQSDIRRQLSAIVSDYLHQCRLVAPLSMDQLRLHSRKIIESTDVDQKHADLLAILINNQAWQDTVAAVPYEKRLLLLPQCLRSRQNCKAEFDELGLICDHCGQCLISDIKTQAEQLGYAVLVAEGSPIVMSLIESGKIEAVIGVSCMAVLERTFPYMEAGAVPGIALPLAYDGCIDTTLDIDWLTESLYLNSTDQVGRLDLDAIKKQVAEWFTSQELTNIFGGGQSKTQQIAIDWLAFEGKRWRPFLTASTYKAVRDASVDEEFDAVLRNTCAAVECFHKASLVHDDIEDDDDIRYGEKTLHAQYGVPIALNVGDLLLGDGYRLISDLPIDAQRKAAMLKVAADGHRDLCIGQGNELVWLTEQRPLTVDEVLEIFRKKTAPAFMVALKLGAILADASADVLNVLEKFSLALGVAYQIKDDIDDYKKGDQTERPSLLLAIKNGSDADIDPVEKADQMMEQFKTQALKCLDLLDNSTLKGLLRRVLCKIFGDIERLRCCDEYKAQHDTGSSQS